MYTDCLTVIFISLATAAASEFISWLLIYRTEDYKSLKRQIDSLNKKLEVKKEKTTSITKLKTKEKKINTLEEQLKVKNRDMSMVKMKSTLFVAFIMIGVFGLLNNLFDGIVVAKLPFEPIPLIRGITHRNLPGNDFTDCSMVFLYALCSLSIRPNLQKFLGFEPKAAQGMGSLFAPPPGSKF
eukprot:TRINITY_DN4309_c0_g1_i3.p2 TRINITY_DN4309_c0_g1~~TRINITY_DN4309_c0_g1_i3.p2  ORF type:complete len:183 (-),score=63.79 TRINITY_DN4309_c0_g1_i3:39-587(-)